MIRTLRREGRGTATLPNPPEQTAPLAPGTALVLTAPPAPSPPILPTGGDARAHVRGSGGGGGGGAGPSGRRRRIDPDTAAQHTYLGGEAEREEGWADAAVCMQPKEPEQGRACCRHAESATRTYGRTRTRGHVDPVLPSKHIHTHPTSTATHAHASTDVEELTGGGSGLLEEGAAVTLPLFALEGEAAGGGAGVGRGWCGLTLNQSCKETVALQGETAAAYRMRLVWGERVEGGG